MKQNNLVFCMIFAIVVILSCAEISLSLGPDSTFGFCSNANRSTPMIRQIVHKPKKTMLGLAVRKTCMEMRFPTTGFLSDRIQCIVIRDISRKGKSAYGTIKEGGINYNHVKMDLKSHRGQDIDLEIKIYTNMMPPSSPQMYPPINRPQPIGWAPNPQPTYYRSGWPGH